ncbi:MAG: NAD-dependent epimerase/dehydratase family protein [Prevotella sp.]
MKVLITGVAGFIGSKIASILASRGDEVVGVDNINDYYDVRLKYARLNHMLGIGTGYLCLEWNKVYFSEKFPKLRFFRLGIDNKEALDSLFGNENFDAVINLAAQAGVRYSIQNPYAYMQSNLQGFLNILEACRNHPVRHLLFASSSSVYGMNTKTPFSEEDIVTTPVSLYAASKKSNELMAHCYAKLYGIPVTGVRYFTVYGPWGRPDMAPMLFANAISKGKSIDVFNNGDMIRDFTYIDDIAYGSVSILDKPPVDRECENEVPYRIFNIGCAHPMKLMDFIHEIETALGKEARMVYKPMQPGDVYMTCADTSRLESIIGYSPKVKLHEGIQSFISWYISDLNPLRTVK